MAKMFYTLEEVSEKLGKTEEEVKEMAASGQLQEFRDRDKLMFKVEQVNLLASGDDSSEVHLDLDAGSSGSGISLMDTSISEPPIGLSDSREETGAQTGTAAGTGTGTGMSVFDTDHGFDDAGDTQVADSVEEELSLESVGSGSGLLDLTRESDDTSLGAELLEEVYSSDDQVEIPAHASGLFEASGSADQDEEAVAVGGGGMAMPMIVESYDGAWSGMGAGLMIGTLAAMICVAIIVIVGLSGATPQLATMISESMWIWVGGLAGLTAILLLIGMFLGKASE